MGQKFNLYEYECKETGGTLFQSLSLAQHEVAMEPKLVKNQQYLQLCYNESRTKQRKNCSFNTVKNPNSLFCPLVKHNFDLGVTFTLSLLNYGYVWQK